MARSNRSLKLSDPLWAAFKLLREPGREWADYKSDNATLEDALCYNLIFRRPHTFRPSQLPLPDQDLIHEFIHHCVHHDIDLRPLLPKPANARALLDLARKWQQ
jgi:hypothetical protein